MLIDRIDSLKILKSKRAFLFAFIGLLLFIALANEVYNRLSGHFASYSLFEIVLIILVAFSGQVTFFLLYLRERHVHAATSKKSIEAGLALVESKYQTERISAYLDATRELASDALLSIDIHEKIIFCNVAAERLFGWPKNSLLGQSLEVVIPDRFRAAHHKHVREFSRREGGTFAMGRTMKIFALRRDGSEIAVEAAISKVVAARSVIMMVSMRDISRIVEAEAELQNAAGIAASSNEARLQFLANVSHELRTPLNAIIGFSQFLGSELCGTLSIQQKGYVNDILKAGNLLASVLNDILLFSKLSAGATEFLEMDEDVVILTRECVDVMQGSSLRRNIQIHFNHTMNLPKLICDSRAFKQILMNLISNAVKFSADAGDVFVNCLLVDGKIQIEVQDHGIGIAREDISRIFEPFRQASEFTTRQHEGTGLGLSIVKLLVAAHGARLKIESAPGAGTIIRIIFPAERVMTRSHGGANPDMALLL